MVVRRRDVEENAGPARREPGARRTNGPGKGGARRRPRRACDVAYQESIALLEQVARTAKQHAEDASRPRVMRALEAVQRSMGLGPRQMALAMRRSADELERDPKAWADALRETARWLEEKAQR